MQYDLIIIGDSKEGHSILKSIASTNAAIKIAFIAKNFKHDTTHDFLSVEYIKNEVVFTDYKNRLFGCYLKNGTRLYATHLVFAVGQKYAPLMLDNKVIPGVFNTLDNIPKQSKMSSAVVLGDKDTDIKFALALAKKYKYIYFCTKGSNLNCSKKLLDKLNDTKNLVVLLNTEISNVVALDNKLQQIELTNYSTITCSAIYVKTETSPDTQCVSTKLIKSSEEGYLETAQDLESTLVPKCYAAGSCVQKSTKKMVFELVKNILTDFKKGEPIC